MSTIHAIFEDGVFKPTTHVDLPERCEVEFDPKPVVNQSPGDENLDRLYEILNRRFTTGQADLSSRHDEHQP